MSDDLENLLRSLPLRRPSASLDERVLTPPREPRTLPWLFGGLAAAAIVALAVTAGMWAGGWLGDAPVDSPNLTHAGDAFEPVRIEEVWSTVEPRGVVVLADNTPARGYVQHTVRHVQLIDDRNNIRIEYTVPRQDFMIVPVEYD